MPPDVLDTLAESLAGTFPGCEDAPLALALLRGIASNAAMARGSSAGIDAIARRRIDLGRELTDLGDILIAASSPKRARQD